MNPLPTHQRVMTWLSICPADSSTSRKQRICYASLTIIVAMVAFANLLSGVAFIMKYVSSDLERSLYATFHVSGHVAILNLIIVSVINRHHIATIYTGLSKLSTENETDSSFRFLAEANKKSEWLWKFYFKFVMKGLFANILVSTIASIVYCFKKHGVFDAKLLYKPHNQILPWNQTTPYGYFAEIAFSIAAVETYSLCVGLALILFASMCLYHQAFYKKFRHDAIKLDQHENKRNANEILYELLRFHISAKDWFLESAEVYSPLGLIQLICNVIYMAAVVFEMDLRLKHINLEFIVLMNAFPVGILNIFVYCYFGHLATESYAKMAECLYVLNWYELSLDFQKKILLMIQNMHKPVYYHGFGVAVLNLETFVTVLRAIFSYYMIFKALTAD